MPVVTRLGLPLLSALLLGCSSTSLPASLSPTSEPSDTASPSTPSAAPSTSAAPSDGEPTGDLLEGFGWNDVLRVEVNGLAVRTAPYTHMPLVTGSRSDGTSIGEVRLNVGDLVSVDLGPVQIGDTTWYRVTPAEGAVRWDTRRETNGVGWAWLAASSGPANYLSLLEAYEHDPNTGLPVTLLVSGTGDYRSEPQDGFDLFGIFWAYLIDDELAPCGFTVTLAPVGGGEGLVAVTESTIGAFDEGIAQASRGSFDPYQVAVSSDCEWSLRVQPFAHD